MRSRRTAGAAAHRRWSRRSRRRSRRCRPSFRPASTCCPCWPRARSPRSTRGDTATHDRLAAEAARARGDAGCDVVALAQFSLARAAPAVARAVPLPVLTTPASAVRALRARIEGAAPSRPPVDVAGLASWLGRHFDDVESIDVLTLAHWLADPSRARQVLVDVRAAAEQAVSTLAAHSVSRPKTIPPTYSAARARTCRSSPTARSACARRGSRARSRPRAPSACSTWGAAACSTGPTGACRCPGPQGRPSAYGYDADWEVLLDARLRA